MAIMSVNSMIRHAKQNAKLYAEMIELGYLDESFPVWWYSPGRAAAEGAKAAETSETPAEAAETLETAAETGEGRTELQGVEGYDPTPPRQPALREGRPALPDQQSTPIQSNPIHAEHVSAGFSDAELSLLKERAVTEITPEQWMHTQSQADGRIVFTCVR